MKGVDVGPNGKTYRWVDFVKIAAVPADAVLAGDTWLTPAGKEIGPSIWGPFAIVLEVLSDAGAGKHDVLYKGVRPGFGWY
jgi:hypothetical protein